VGQTVGVRAGLDDGATVEGETVDDGRAQARVVKVLVQPEKDSLEAIAMEFFSSLSVTTWNSSSAPRWSSAM